MVNRVSSAVNIANLDRSIVPDNSFAMQQLGRGLSAAGGAFGKRMGDKRDDKITSDLVAQLDSFTNGGDVALAQEGLENQPEPSFEQQQFELDKQVVQQGTEQQFEARQTEINTRANTETMVQDEKFAEVMFELQRHDPQAAQQYMQFAAFNDAAEKAQLHKELINASRIWSNVQNGYISEKGVDVKGFKRYIAGEIQANDKVGANADKLREGMSLTDPDQIIAFTKRMSALTGTLVQAEGEMARLNREGKLLSNESSRLANEQAQQDLNQAVGVVGGDIINPSPKDFTVSSIAQYQKTGDASDLVRYHSASEKRGQKIIGEGLLAAQALPRLNRSLELLESIETGGFAQAALRSKNFLGIESADEAELSNNLGRAVISQYREVFGAQFTEPEGDKLDRIEASLGKSTVGNKRVISQLVKMTKLKVKHGLSRAEKIDDLLSIDEMNEYMNLDLTPIAEATQALPQGVTEADIELTMQNNNMTREQVLTRLSGG